MEEGVRGLVGEKEFGVRDAAAIGDVGQAGEGGLFGSGADDVEEDIGAILEGQSGGVEGGEVATRGTNGEEAERGGGADGGGRCERGAEERGVDAVGDDVEAIWRDALGEEPVLLNGAHEDDGVESAEAAGAADDFGQLMVGLVEGADPADAGRFGEEIEEGEVAVTPEVVDDALEAGFDAAADEAVDCEAATNAPAGEGGAAEESGEEEGGGGGGIGTGGGEALTGEVIGDDVVAGTGGEEGILGPGEEGGGGGWAAGDGRWGSDGSLFSVLCSLFSVLCSLFSVLCSLFSVRGLVLGDWQKNGGQWRVARRGAE